MNFVNKQDVVLFQIGQQRRQVFGLFQHRAAGLAQVHTQFVSDDVRQRSFAQSGWAKQQHMVQRLVAFFSRANEDLQLLTHFGLAYVLVEQFWAQGTFNGLFSPGYRHSGHHARRCIALRVGGEIVGLNAHSVWRTDARLG